MADYIDREELIVKFQQLADIEWNKETGTSWANAFFEAVDIIDDMPSADVQPVVHGEWRDAYDKGDGIQAAECSVCDRVSLVGDYCPNCGARMEVDDG